MLNAPLIGDRARYLENMAGDEREMAKFSTGATSVARLITFVLSRPIGLGADRVGSEELRERIDNEVSSAFLDPKTAGDLVGVVGYNLELANKTLPQSKSVQESIAVLTVRYL